jgi:hypothetical protein
MCRSFVESNSGSYAGRIAPPGMPKTTCAPALSRDRTRLWAPVIVSVAEATATTGPGALADGVVGCVVGGVGVGAGPGGLGAVIGPPVGELC